MTLLEEGYFGGDLIIEEGASPLVTRETVEVENQSADNDLVLKTGYIVKEDGDYVFDPNGTELDDIYGIVIHETFIPAGETRKVAVLRRGPAAINANVLQGFYVDADSLVTETAIVAADLKTNIETNLELVVVRDEPANAEIQNT